MLLDMLVAAAATVTPAMDLLLPKADEPLLPKADEPLLPKADEPLDELLRFDGLLFGDPLPYDPLSDLLWDGPLQLDFDENDANDANDANLTRQACAQIVSLPAHKMRKRKSPIETSKRKRANANTDMDGIRVYKLEAGVWCYRFAPHITLKRILHLFKLPVKTLMRYVHKSCDKSTDLAGGIKFGCAGERTNTDRALPKPFRKKLGDPTATPLDHNAPDVPALVAQVLDHPLQQARLCKVLRDNAEKRRRAERTVTAQSAI